tara:strand:- start:1713 stop:1913 length:201 start_codon:yes stop_codon:yes gene_type:complete
MTNKLPKDVIEKILDYIPYYKNNYNKVIKEMEEYDLFLPLILYYHSPVEYSLKCIRIVEEYDIYTN